MRSKACRLIAGTLLMASLMLSLCSCSRAADTSIYGRCSKYLGEADYTASLTAMTYEQIPDEEAGYFGILYREVTDIDGLLAQGQVPVCLYFYNSMASSDTIGITAGVEDLAQVLSDQVLFIAVDGMVETGLSGTYSVEAYPEFVLIPPGGTPVKFEGFNYDTWDASDVASWLESNGYTPDYTKLQ